MDDKYYTIFQVMELIKNNKELIFEIRDKKQKDGWFKHMLLICTPGLSAGYFLKYYLKPSEDFNIELLGTKVPRFLIHRTCLL